MKINKFEETGIAAIIAISVVAILAILSIFYITQENRKEPFTILKQAQDNTNKLPAVKKKISIKIDDKLFGLTTNLESVVVYNFNEKKGYAEIRTDKDIISVYADKDRVYVKDGEIDKYVDLTDSLVSKLTLTMINFPEFNNNDTLTKNLTDLIELVEKENAFMKKTDIIINGKKQKVDKITVTLPKEKVKEVISQYIIDITKKTMANAAGNLAEFQILMEENITGEKMNEEEKEKIKKDIQSKIEKQLEEQINSVDFSAVELEFYIKKGLIVAQEETFYIKSEGQSSQFKISSEILEYGDKVKCPDIAKEDIISLEEYFSIMSQ